MHRATHATTCIQEAQPEIAASVASVDTAPSATPSTSAVKRHAATLLAAAQTKSKQIPGQVAEAAMALPGEMTSAGKELGGQAKDIAASTGRALSALPGQTSRALSSTKAAYAQGKAATIMHIEQVCGNACISDTWLTSAPQSQLPDSVKRAALAALVKQRETVVVPDITGKVALVTGGMYCAMLSDTNAPTRVASEQHGRHTHFITSQAAWASGSRLPRRSHSMAHASSSPAAPNRAASSAFP